MAARTDPELRALLHPLEQRFDAMTAHWGRELFVSLSASPEAFEVERRFVYYLMHGLALKRRGGADTKDIEATLDDLKRAMRRARARATEPNAPARNTKSKRRQP